jgi:lipid-A-disaccharide synthase
VGSHAPVIALLPGSRRQEWRSLGPVLLGAAARLQDRYPDARFVIPVVDDQAAAAIERAVARHSIGARTVLCRDSHLAMRSADLAMMSSGTASLEAALIGTPAIIVYKVSAATHLIVRTAIALRLIDSFTAGLPNLILKRRVVPEFLQTRATVESVAREAAELLDDAARLARMRKDYELVADQVRGKHPLTDVAASVLRWADAGRRRSAEAPHRTVPGSRPIPAHEAD